MKPLSILLFTLGICCIRPTAAQEPVTVSFSNPVLQESEFIQASANLQRIYALKTLITGKIAGTRYRLDLVHITDGKENRRLPMNDLICESDTLEFFLASQPVSTDSVHIILRSPITRLCALGVPGTDKCILMETIPGKRLTTDDAIPVAAFCQGEPIEIPMKDGTVLKGLHYCRVRDSHLHPSKWHERFKLKDYLYFEIKFTNPQRPENK